MSILRWLAGIIIRLLQIILLLGGLVFGYGMILGGADLVGLGIAVVVAFATNAILVWLHARITDPYNPKWHRPKKPTRAKPKKAPKPKPALAIEPPKPVEDTPPPVTKATRAPDRKFATPPTVQKTSPDLRVVPSAMEDKMKRFLDTGIAAVKTRQD